ncbi:hypothetical protein ACOMHN_061853 [Nucella lapillus]
MGASAGHAFLNAHGLPTGQHTKRLGSARDSVRKANCSRSQQHRMEKVRRATQEERRRQEQAEAPKQNISSPSSLSAVPALTLCMPLDLQTSEKWFNFCRK